MLLFVAVAAVGAEGVEAAEEAHLLPRPLVIELPTSATEEVLEEVRCASWRLAGEANNLAPWRAMPEECAGYVRDYLTGLAYRSDLEVVAR
ncbi:hypothetical protein E2562_011334 [Oryza meyeriana var. granulata]|uniref:Uncharacterized protein n=1 Tax=Oryza meyeriana var. granulata TaxID=110450 RepID=A0A6G1BX61_9ORYZ|nr:hypothetical protein E2562_011334 [Oryza meyeriana var. granulata]